jgi:integrase
VTVAALTLDAQPARRVARDRLELLTALINGPSVDLLFRDEVIQIPPHHAAYPWHCVVAGCERPRWSTQDLCFVHAGQWGQAKASGMTRRVFVNTAEALKLDKATEALVCRICRHRPAASVELALCARHRYRWRHHRTKYGSAVDFDTWLASQSPCPTYGRCRARVCDELACTPLGLCPGHADRYRRAGKPGGASLPAKWQYHEFRGVAVPVGYRDEAEFDRWCATALPVVRIGQINLRGLRPLLAAEIRWGLHTHAQGFNPPWYVPRVQSFVDHCQQRDVDSLVDLDPGGCLDSHWQIVKNMRQALQLVYFSPTDTRDAGFIETEHFGVRFPGRRSHIDLTSVSLRWLRDVLWDYLAAQLRSPQGPRTAGHLDAARKACAELSAFLAAETPAHGEDPTLLRAEHMYAFVADLRHRERTGSAAWTMRRPNGQPTVVSEVIRRLVLNAGRRVLRTALESGEADRLGLDRGFITAMPPGGRNTRRTRTPFPDEVARALADETNLQRLAAYDPRDWGLCDIWKAIILTGRRASEVIKLRWDCVGHYNGLPMLWHDQTKVGNYDEAIRIPEQLSHLIRARQNKTLAVFADRHGGRAATADERAVMMLFPTNRRNDQGMRPVSYNWFHKWFRQWIDELDLGRYVAHQARHTMATRLLRHGATLTHIRKYLGHVSDRMAEQYIKVAVSEIEDVLQHVWVSGPGAANPGELLSTPVTPLDRGQAEALALDLTRRSTPTEGGLCTFQPVVNGRACPWKLDCENCDKFVLTGADLLYWRRKREQWRTIAERAPDDATADYLHQVFEPTAQAIDGLEKALAGLGLLDDALALDLRRPQDYFQRLWSIGFRANELTNIATGDPDGEQEQPA